MSLTLQADYLLSEQPGKSNICTKYILKNFKSSKLLLNTWAFCFESNLCESSLVWYKETELRYYMK